MISLFLGAGFSKWAANLPLVGELFDFNISTYNQRDCSRLESITRLKENWDKNNPDKNNEFFIRDMLTESNLKKRLVKWFVTRRLSDPFIATVLGGTQVLMIDDKRALSMEGVKKAQEFLARYQFSSEILTTNYDLLIEYALGTSGFNYGIYGQQLVGRGKNPVFPWQGGPTLLKGLYQSLKFMVVFLGTKTTTIIPMADAVSKVMP